MTPTFSLITPSLQRDSLLRCCESVNSQTLKDGWQHVVQVDAEQWNLPLIAKILHPQRVLVRCGQHHGNYGNHCRYDAWAYATGAYCIFLDDDNYMSYDDALADIEKALTATNFPQFAIFPIMRHGRSFFHDPPGLCMTDSANIVVQRQIGRWPDIEAREADGHFVESLKEHYTYAAFPDASPIITMEYSSNGV